MELYLHAGETPSTDVQMPTHEEQLQVSLYSHSECTVLDLY